MTDYEKLSDRELDALVAEKVFGIDGVTVGDAYGSIVVYYHKTNKFGSEIIHNVPQYSSCIAAAWEVEMLMASKGYFSGHTDLSIDSGCMDYCWKYYDYNNNTLKAGEGRGNAPRAICLAALRAVDNGKSQ